MHDDHIGESLANAVSSFYWGPSPGGAHDWWKVGNPIARMKACWAIARMWYLEKNTSILIATTWKGICNHPCPLMPPPDSKIASITCPAMDCRNAESLGCIHIHIKETAHSKTLNCTYTFLFEDLDSTLPQSCTPCPIFFCRNPAWPQGLVFELVKKTN